MSAAPETAQEAPMQAKPQDEPRWRLQKLVGD